MAIVNHTLETSAQANGSTHNVLRMYDQDGIEHLTTFYAQSGVNPSSLVDAHIATANAQLAEQEFGAIISEAS